jgi:hypothetical protein
MEYVAVVYTDKSKKKGGYYLIQAQKSTIGRQKTKPDIENGVTE